jgi:hypothetical protein
VEPALEMSRRGGHLWIFLATPLLAKECRIYIHDLASRLGVPVKGAGLADGIEVFPKHDAIGASEFGNAIRGPLGIHRGANRRFWFYGANYTLEDQIAYLNRLRKVTEEELRQFIVGKERPEPDFATRSKTDISREPRKGSTGFSLQSGDTPVPARHSFICGVYSAIPATSLPSMIERESTMVRTLTTAVECRAQRPILAKVRPLQNDASRFHDQE